MVPDLICKAIAPHPSWAPSIREVGGVCRYCKNYLNRTNGRECSTLLRFVLNKAIEQEPMITDFLIKELDKFIQEGNKQKKE